MLRSRGVHLSPVGLPNHFFPRLLGHPRQNAKNNLRYAGVKISTSGRFLPPVFCQRQQPSESSKRGRGSCKETADDAGLRRIGRIVCAVALGGLMVFSEAQAVPNTTESDRVVSLGRDRLEQMIREELSSRIHEIPDEDLIKMLEDLLHSNSATKPPEQRIMTRNETKNAEKNTPPPSIVKPFNPDIPPDRNLADGGLFRERENPADPKSDLKLDPKSDPNLKIKSDPKSDLKSDIRSNFKSESDAESIVKDLEGDSGVNVEDIDGFLSKMRKKAVEEYMDTSTSQDLGSNRQFGSNGDPKDQILDQVDQKLDSLGLDFERLLKAGKVAAFSGVFIVALLWGPEVLRGLFRTGSAGNTTGGGDPKPSQMETSSTSDSTPEKSENEADGHSFENQDNKDQSEANAPESGKNTGIGLSFWPFRKPEANATVKDTVDGKGKARVGSSGGAMDSDATEDSGRKLDGRSQGVLWRRDDADDLTDDLEGTSSLSGSENEGVIWRRDDTEQDLSLDDSMDVLIPVVEDSSEKSDAVDDGSVKEEAEWKPMEFPDPWKRRALESDKPESSENCGGDTEGALVDSKDGALRDKASVDDKEVGSESEDVKMASEEANGSEEVGQGHSGEVSGSEEVGQGHSEEASGSEDGREEGKIVGNGQEDVYKIIRLPVNGNLLSNVDDSQSTQVAKILLRGVNWAKPPRNR